MLKPSSPVPYPIWVTTSLFHFLFCPLLFLVPKKPLFCSCPIPLSQCPRRSGRTRAALAARTAPVRLGCPPELHQNPSGVLLKTPTGEGCGEAKGRAGHSFMLSWHKGCRFSCPPQLLSLPCREGWEPAFRSPRPAALCRQDPGTHHIPSVFPE